MGYFPVTYDSGVVNYDRRGFIRLATGLLLIGTFLHCQWATISCFRFLQFTRCPPTPLPITSMKCWEVQQPYRGQGWTHLVSKVLHKSIILPGKVIPQFCSPMTYYCSAILDIVICGQWSSSDLKHIHINTYIDVYVKIYIHGCINTYI